MLNAEQKKAVQHGGGPLLVIAGAGTGKTTVIIQRIAHLIKTKKAKPGEILALTFTDKAADEMETRVDQLVPYGYIDVAISTFHAFGDRVLRDHALELGMQPDFRVLTLAEQLVFLREHIFELPLKHYKSLGDPTKHLKALLGAISRAQDEDLEPEAYLKWAKKAKEPRQLEVAKVYKKYQQLKAKRGFVDFADQVGLCLKLFRKRPDILKLYQKRFKYILVDEFQDTNYAQFELLKLLAGQKANLTAVGDDDQSIYKFRGAAISNILGFQKVYNKSKLVVLINNYRSTQIILDTAYRLIKHNDPDRLEVKAKINKRLKSFSEAAQHVPEHLHFDRVSSEADWVAQTIKKNGYNYSDCAILVRANSSAEPYQKSLNMVGIPSLFSGGGGLYVSPAVKLAVAFLRVIGDLADSISLYDLALSLVYQLNPFDLQKINTFARRRNLTLHHVFTHLGELEVLSDIRKESQATVQKIMADIAYYLSLAKDKTTGEVLYLFLKKSGLLAKLTKEDSQTNEQELKNLSAFFERVRAFKEITDNDRVAEFVKHLNLLKDAGDNPESAVVDQDVDAVNILTIHKAKGLEFKVVFLVSLVVDKFPLRQRKDPISLPADLIKEVLPDADFHLQEERRLFYVGMTRAKERLFLTSSESYGGKRARKISRFVLEALDLPKADTAMIKMSPQAQIELFAPVESGAFPTKKMAEDETVYLSHYQIDDYLTCPLKYKYVHILRVPLLPNHQIIYGAALHQAVQAYSLARMNGLKFSEKNLLDVLQKNWSAEGFISREHEEQRLNKAKQTLKRFYKKEQKSKRQIKFVEESFSVAKDNIVLRGRWDRVDCVGSKIYIVDYKSSEVREQEKADQRAKKSLQLSIYALVWLERFKESPHRVELNFLESGLVGSVKKEVRDLTKAWEKILQVAAGIRAAEFPAKPNIQICNYCPYSEICPASSV